MKFSIIAASLALAASVSAQAVGPVDPNKLPTGWCMMYEDSCTETAIVAACGANSTFASSCKSTFSTDKVCTSFVVSCTCTSLGGGALKDVSLPALDEALAMGMCDNLEYKNSTTPGLESTGYKPDGKKPGPGVTNVTGITATPSGSTPTTSTSPSSTSTPGKSAAASIQMAIPSIALAAISVGLAMIPL
ncbi:hypothetical protein FBU30_006297 [Linnemannia zychae]|nr:hypothetical protein FBU30_006297 [Linnemannia zychae]